MATEHELMSRYQAAVELLLPLAKQDTSGSVAAAQVLLSTYNAYEFHLNPIDLGLLEPQYIKAAFDVVQIRIILSVEPHTIIDNGDSEFESLWCRWDGLRICNRYKRQVMES